MSSVGITDYGNLFGAFEFVSICYENNIKPILGCEFYLVDDRKKRQFTLQNKDKRFSQVLYAKNKNGYQNLCKISSYGYIDGLYAGFPRIDKQLVQTYKDDLIATTSGMYGEIAHLFFNVGESKAKECFLWWLNEFQEDFYVELSRNNLDNEDELNKLLLKWAHEYNVKCLPSNRIYYLEQSDSKAHDALLCVKNGEQINTPKGTGHGFRFGMPNDNFYFKTQEEMVNLFSDLPNIFNDLDYFVQQFDTYTLSRDVLLSKYDLGFSIEYLTPACAARCIIYLIL